MDYLDHYKEYGYAVVKSVFRPAEIDALAEEFTRIKATALTRDLKLQDPRIITFVTDDPGSAPPGPLVVYGHFPDRWHGRCCSVYLDEPAQYCTDDRGIWRYFCFDRCRCAICIPPSPSNWTNFIPAYSKFDKPECAHIYRHLVFNQLAVRGIEYRE